MDIALGVVKNLTNFTYRGFEKPKKIPHTMPIHSGPCSDKQRDEILSLLFGNFSVVEVFDNAKRGIFVIFFVLVLVYPFTPPKG